MADTKTTKAYIVRDFNDAGTERSFEKGSTVDIDVGSFKNYAAAGLVREPTADETKPAKAA